MPDAQIILVEPKTEGNIGAVARIMKNFGFTQMGLVKPCEIGDVAFKRAMHAGDVLETRKEFDTLESCLKNVDYIVGTSGIESVSDRKYLRKNITPKEFVALNNDINGKVGILFGREDFGLYNSELERCDTVITIPSHPEYPILNLSHSVGIVLYELFQSKSARVETKKATGFERDKLIEQFEMFLDSIDYPEHKRKNTTVMLQRILGRAAISKWEFHCFMGVFSRAMNSLGSRNASK
jgi:TrmH family RNA methyltransferase